VKIELNGETDFEQPKLFSAGLCRAGPAGHCRSH